MELTVFVMVIAAALLHAVWNAVVKIQGDRLVGNRRQNHHGARTGGDRSRRPGDRS